MSTVDETIGRNLARIRTEAGVSVMHLAEALDVSSEEIPSLEDGSKRITASQIWVLSEFLGKPVSAFFEGAA